MIMTRYGYFLSCEEYGPAELVRQARLAEVAGFEALWVSDHFHPWPTDVIPGEAAQLLPLPRHFGQLAELVSEDMVSAPCGPDPATHLDGVRAYTEAGSDEVYIGQVGGEAEGFFEFYATQVLPHLREG
jgi:hypothetical protein